MYQSTQSHSPNRVEIEILGSSGLRELYVVLFTKNPRSGRVRSLAQRKSSGIHPRLRRPHILGSETTVCALPLLLARYIARSAARINSSGVSSEPIAMPMLAVAYRWYSRRSRGARSGLKNPP